MVDMAKAIKISDEDYKLISIIRNREDWTYTKTISKAIKFFAKAKRILKG
jgi:hypothetical protein